MKYTYFVEKYVQTGKKNSATSCRNAVKPDQFEKGNVF